MTISSTEKGNNFENQVYEAINGLLVNDNFYVPGKRSKIFQKKGYYSKNRERDIIVDISIETFLEKAEKYSLLTIIECKNLNTPVPVDDVEEFDSKLRQLGEHNLKGILISRSGFQKGTLQVARSMGIGLINIKERKDIEWVNYRKDKNFKRFDSSKIEEKLLNINTLETNFFACLDQKSFEYLPELLLELGIIDVFKNNIKYMQVPFMENSQIQEIVDSFFPSILYENEQLDHDRLCDFLEEKLQVSFVFDRGFENQVLGKAKFRPLQIHINAILSSDMHRWRFTLAHEIGHLILHKNYLERFVDENFDLDENINLNQVESIHHNKRLEIQANLFASFLLIPQKPLLSCVNDYFKKWNNNKGYLYFDHQPVNQGLVLGLLGELQDLFGVSLDVAKYRLIGLGLLKDTIDTSFNGIFRNSH